MLIKLNKSLKTRVKQKEEIKGTYFSNGSQFRDFQDNNCFECLNYRAIDTKEPLCVTKKEGTGYGCSITDLFELYQDNMTNDMRNMLIKDNECVMKLAVDEAKIKGDLLLNEENERLRQDIKNLKAGFNQLSILDSEVENENS